MIPHEENDFPCHGGGDELFNALSKFAVDIMPFLPFVVFWCADMKWGYRLIEPAGDSKVVATGYSFPSGHWGNMIARFIMVFYAMNIWPMVITKTCEKG